MSANYVSVGLTQVFVGAFIPMHDTTNDLAEEIGQKVEDFHAYVTSVRDSEQADAAVIELLTAMVEATKAHTLLRAETTRAVSEQETS